MVIFFPKMSNNLKIGGKVQTFGKREKNKILNKQAESADRMFPRHLNNTYKVLILFQKYIQ